MSPLYVYKDELHLRAFSSKKEGLTLADWTSLSNFLKNSAADPDAEFKINMGADIHSPGFIELITSIQNYDYILNIVKTLWNATVDNHLNYPIGALAILSFLMGKEGRKQGLLQWLISVANNSEDLYQKHFTNKNKRKLANKSKQAAQVPLKIKDAGTSIELKSQKRIWIIRNLNTEKRIAGNIKIIKKNNGLNLPVTKTSGSAINELRVTKSSVYAILT